VKTLLDHPETTTPISLENIKMASQSVKGEKTQEISKLIEDYTKKHYP
jgi:hypothetical protein